MTSMENHHFDIYVYHSVSLDFDLINDIQTK